MYLSLKAELTFYTACVCFNYNEFYEPTIIFNFTSYLYLPLT